MITIESVEKRNTTVIIEKKSTPDIERQHFPFRTCLNGKLGKEYTVCLRSRYERQYYSVIESLIRLLVVFTLR